MQTEGIPGRSPNSVLQPEGKLETEMCMWDLELQNCELESAKVYSGSHCGMCTHVYVHVASVKYEPMFNVGDYTYK